jgi:hypothetical protein
MDGIKGAKWGRERVGRPTEHRGRHVDTVHTLKQSKCEASASGQIIGIEESLRSAVPTVFMTIHSSWMDEVSMRPATAA